MRLLLVLGVLTGCLISPLFAQSQRPNPAISSKVLPLLDADSDPLSSSDDLDPIEEQINAFQKNYRYPSPTSTTYDTIIRNTGNFRSNDVPKYTPQQIADRLYNLPTLIPMDYNVHVQRYINVYTVRKRDLSAKVLGLSRVYFPIFEEALDREGMPMEIKYLSIVESALNPHARSRVGATGLWQFMLGTARMYGLEVNSFVDERKDPYKSTEAAIRYLKAAHEEFGDWLLAIASYNCGPGNVRKAIRRSGGKRTFWEVMPYLPRETRGYVPAFIAVNYVFNYPSEHNLYPVYVDFNLNQDSLHLRKMDITLQEIAQMCRADVDELRYLNPELKLDRVPYSDKNYILRVTPRVAAYFAQYPNRIRLKYGKKRDMAVPVANRPKPGASANYDYSPPPGTKLYYHRVKSGEVVGQIAERWSVSPRQIANWNNLYRYRIKVGQKLKIYTTPSKAANAANFTPAPPKPKTEPAQLVPTPAGAKYHTVKQGDTLWDIAKRHNVSVSDLKRLNSGLDARDLKIGQRIRVR